MIPENQLYNISYVIHTNLKYR